MSAQTAYAAEESDAEDSALSHPAPLTRASTRFYDAGQLLFTGPSDLSRFLLIFHGDLEERGRI